MTYHAADVRCPYYKDDDGKHKIVCEGIIPGTSAHSCFARHKDYEIQVQLFCSGHYWSCEICTALDQKYEEE